MEPELFNTNQFNSFINEISKISKLKDPVFDVYENKVEARERTANKTKSFFFSKAPIKQLNLEDIDLGGTLSSHIVKITDAEESKANKKSTLKTIQKAISNLDIFLKSHENLEARKWNKFADLKHTLELVNSFLDPQPEKKIEAPAYKSPSSSLDEQLSIMRNYSLGNTEGVDKENREIIQKLISDPAIRKVFEEFIKRLTHLKKENEKIFNNLEILPLIHSAANELLTQIISIANVPLLDNDLSDTEQQQYYKLLYSLLLDLYQSTGTLANTQLHTDSIETALPTDLLLKFHHSIEGPIRRHLDTAQFYEKQYQDQKRELEQTESNPEELAKHLKQLDFTRGYSPQSSSFLDGKAAWENIERTETQPFVSGKRVVGYMNPDQTKKKEIEIELNLKPLGKLDEIQCAKVFNFLSEFALGINKYADFVQTHYGKTQVLENVPEVLQEQLKALDFLDEKQKMQLLQIAIDFEYGVYYNMSKARFELLSGD